MSYSRRDLLRDAAIVSVAGCSGYGLSFVSGCDSEPAKPGQRPSSFALGIRIFFVGAWIFCVDPDSPKERIRAVSMEPACMPHWFPYGKWDPNRQWDGACKPQLGAWTFGTPVPSVSFEVNCRSPKSIDTLATAAHKQSPVVYPNRHSKTIAMAPSHAASMIFRCISERR